MIISIDPGTTKSGLAIIHNEKIQKVAHLENEEVLGFINRNDLVIVEWTVYYGERVGKSTFRTAQFCGDIRHACRVVGAYYHEMSRPNVCKALIGMSDKKPVVNKALKEMYLKKEEVERVNEIPKEVRKHIWDALALFHGWKVKNSDEYGKYCDFVKTSTAEALQAIDTAPVIS